jgi:trimeric autotransporter adhesin
MSSRFSWIRKLINPWSRKASEAKRRPFHRSARPSVEQLEVREVPTGTLSLSGGVLTLADTGSPIITVALASSNYTITDSNGISGSISGWTISGNTATETDAGAGSITGLTFNTTNGTFGNSTTGIVAGAATAVTVTDAGNVTIGGAFTGATTGNLTISATGSIADNAAITLTTGKVAISANTAGSGAAGFAQAASGATITSTNTSSTAVTINVNTSGGGTGDASIRSIVANSGTLTVNSRAGNILYAGTDTLDSEQSAQTTLAPGITGPAPSFNTGSAPTGTVNAKSYVFTSTGTASIGTAARPIETSSPSSNTESLTAGSGGIYFVDWGNPLSLSGATAAGAGNVVVVAANAGGHNLTVTGNVSTGSGNIVLAADDNLVVNSSVTIGGSGFSGDVYLAANRDTGNTDTLTMSGTITSSNTSASAVVIEGFHAANNGTSAGTITVNNITVGDGGTITVSGVPSSLATGQSAIVASNSSSVLNAGPTGTVNFIATSVNGGTGTSAVGTAATPMTVTAGNVVVTANVGTGSSTTTADPVYVTDTIAGNFAATTGTTSPSGSINLTTTSGMLTVNGATNTGNSSAIILTGAGGVTVSAALGNSTTGNIAIIAGSNSVTFTTAQTFTSNEPVAITASNAAELQASSSVTLDGGTVTTSNGIQVDQSSTLAWTGSGSPTVSGPLTVSGNIAPSGSTTGTLNTGDLTLNATAVLTVNASTAASGQYSAVNVTGTATLDPSSTLAVNVIGTSLNLNDQLTILTASNNITTTFANSTVTSGSYTFSIGYVGNTVVLTVMSAPANTSLDVTGGVVTFTAQGGAADTVTVSNNGTTYTINDPAEPIVLTANAVGASWSNIDANTVTGPMSGITDLSILTSGGADVVSGIAAGSADVAVSGATSLSVAGDITTTGNVTFSGFPTVDFEADVTTTGNITFSSVGAITDGTTGTPGTLTGASLTLTASNGIGSGSLPVLTAGTTVTVSPGAIDAFVTQTAGSVAFSGTATGSSSLNLSDTDPAGTLTIAGATSVAGGNINLSSAGDLTVNADITKTSSVGSITLSSGNNIFDNANISAGGSVIEIDANTDGSGTAGFTQAASGATITSTNAGNAVTINVNTGGGGTGNASIRAIAASSGNLTVNTYGGSILYAGTDTLDVQQSATFTLFPGITGPAPSGTGAGGSGAAPTGTVNALHYFLSTDPNGTGSIGTADRPINTTTPTNNTEALNAGSGGVYFVDWGNPMTLAGASATGAGDVEVVSANASGHNLTVNGNVSTGSGNIVLAADDNLVISSSVTIGGAGFSGGVYLAGNRDTGNTETVTVSGTVTTSSTSSTAVVIEGFHAAGNGTNAGGITVNNITTGDGGTITLSTVPYNLASGQGSITATNSSSVLNAGPTGTVNFVVTTIAGSSATTAVGTSGTPIMVTAGNVNVAAQTGTAAGFTAVGDSVYVTDTIGGNFAATTGSTSPGGSINLVTTSGVLTVTGATNTGTTSAINLTGAAGVTISAPLGSTATGAIAINGGSGGVLFTSAETFYSNNHVTVTASSPAEVGATSTITLSSGLLISASGVQIDNGGTLTGTGTVNSGANELTVDGTLTPSVSTAGLTTDLTLNSNSTLNVTLNGTGPGEFSVVNVNGPVTLNGPTLVINLGGPVHVNDEFEIINNDGTLDPVTGSFGNDASLTAANLPGYTFSINYAGGDNNDVILMVTAVPQFNTFDVTGSTGTFIGAPSVNSNLTMTDTAGVYTLTDASGEAIVLTDNAVAAGWTNNNPNEVTGPTSYVSSELNTINITDLAFVTADGSDAFASLAAGDANVSIDGFGSLALNGAVTTTGNVAIADYLSVDFEGDVTATGDITFSNVGAITDGGAATLTGDNLTLAASNGIGTAANPVFTNGSAPITVSPGSSSAYVTQTTGSVTFNASATGTGNLGLSDADPTGTLTVATPITTVSGNIALSAAGAIADNANINAGSGTITISADTAGSGTAGFTQASGISITTTNTTTSAATITVNTLGGGAGNAVLGAISVGNSAGGTLTVNSHGGSILWNGTLSGTPTQIAQQQGLAGNGGSAPTPVISAVNYNFTATGAGSIGTDATPIQATNFGADGTGNSNFSLNGGDGGVYFVKWSGIDMTLTGASATGSGNIRIVTANAGGDNMFVTGSVSAINGNIYLAADDNLEVHGASTVIGGASFTGTVWMEGNRDLATTGQPVKFDSTDSILTSNTTNQTIPLSARTPTTQAVYIDIGGGTAAGGGIVQVANITVGDGGRVVLNGSNLVTPTQSGSISMASSSNVINVGLTGILELDAILSSTTVADDIGTSLAPIKVAGGNVVVNSQFGRVWVTGTATTTFAATMTVISGQTTAPSINLGTSAGQAIVGAALSNLNNGTINLTSNGSGGGVVLNADVGSSGTGAIAINGPLSGAGNIHMGAGGLTVAQDTDSTYDGAVDGSSSDTVVYSGAGTLSLTNNNTYTGLTTINSGTLSVVNGGKITGNITVMQAGRLAGSGTVLGSVSDNGVVFPSGDDTPATLTVGSVAFAGAGAYDVKIDGTTGANDQLNATNATLTGGTLNVYVVAGPDLQVGNTFTILNSTNAISGQFTNGTTVSATNDPAYTFTVSYTTNTVVLTLVQILTNPEIDVINGNQVQYITLPGMDSALTVSLSNDTTTYTVTDTGTPTIILTQAAVDAGWSVTNNVAHGPTLNITSMLLQLNDGDDSIVALDGGSASVTITGSGTLAVGGTTTTTGSLTISQFGTVTNNAAVSATAGITVSSPDALTLNGSGSFTSTSGNVAVNSDLSIGDGLTFGGSSTVTFDAGGGAMTLGSETITHGALVIQNASTLTLNGVLTDSLSSITVSSVTDVAAGGGENLFAPTLNLTSFHSLGTSANPLVSSAGAVTASTGSGGVYFTQNGSSNFSASATGAGNVSITDTNSADTVTIAGNISTVAGNIVISAAGAVTDNFNINSGTGTITISANTAGTGTAGFSETTGLIQSANTTANAISIIVNTASGGTGNASIDNITAAGRINVNTFGGSIVYAGTNALTNFQLGVTGDGGSAPTRVLSAPSYSFTTSNTGGAAGSVGTAARPLQLNSPATASLTASAGDGGVYVVDWGTVGSATLTLAGATATGPGGILVVAANSSGHNLTITGPVTTGSGNILLAADDNFVDSAPIGGPGFSGQVYFGANRDTGNTGTLTMTAGSNASNSGSITTSNTSANAVLLEDYSISGTIAGALTLGNITVGTGGTITATTIPTLGIYNPAVNLGAADILAGSSSVVLSAPGGTVVLIAAPRDQTSATAGIGTSAIPIMVSAANVVAVDTSSTTAATGSIYVTGINSTNFAATVTDTTTAGSINLSVTSGTLTINGATNTAGGGAINLTDTVGDITISAPLGSASSGAIAINAGANDVLFSISSQTFTSNEPVSITAGTPAEIGTNVAITLNNGSWTSASGTQKDAGALLGGTGTINSAVTVAGGGTLSPGAPVGTLNVSSFTLAASSTLNVTLDDATDFSQIVYTGTADLGGASLQVDVGGNVNLNEVYTIVSGGALSGVFGNTTTEIIDGVPTETIVAANNPFYVFSVSYDNNNVTLKVIQVPTSDIVDVVGSAVNFYTLAGVANNLTVSLTGDVYSINDSAEVITLSAAATAAGWTGDGTNTVTGPTTYNSGSTTITSLAFSTQDGADTVSLMTVGSADVSITGDSTGALDFEGNVTTTGNLAISGYTAITDGAAGSTGILTANDLTMAAPNGVGTLSNPILTAAQSDTTTTTAGAIYITQTGTGSITATASGAVALTSTAGTLTAAVTSTTGDVTLSTADSLVLGGDLNAGNGHIIINADTDGLAAAGTASYDQAGFSLITTNTDDVLYGFGMDAAVITVNASGGFGDAIIGMGSIGSNAGGGLAINSYGGSILWSNDAVYAPFTASQTGLSNGGSNTQTLKANNYVFSCTGTGSIGTSARPIQTAANAPTKGLNDANVTLGAGSGGIYLVDWASVNDALTVESAIATGAGNIRIVAANAGAHNMYVTGPVTTGSGSIAIYADDDLILTTSLFTNTAASIGDSNFSGTVDLRANRDLGNEQILAMGAGTFILTSNTSPNAVSILCNSSVGSADSPGDSLIPTGGVVLTSITVGDGGGITVAANNAGGGGGSSAPAGSIAQRGGGLLDAGANGTITLTASANGTTTNDGNIGASSSAIQVAAGAVQAATLGIAAGTFAAPTGNIFLNSVTGATYTASTSGNSAAIVNLAGQVNATLTTPAAAYNSVGTDGTPLDLSTASLNVTEAPGFSQSPTGSFDILVNATGQPFAAPFSNYAEGQIFTVGSDQYQITYLGGSSGHDVVLTFLGPVITLQPADQAVIVGHTATFTAGAFGANSTPTVQWYVNINDGNGFQAISMATSTTLTVSNATLAMSGYQYEAIFTNSYGSATTRAATLTVGIAPVVLTDPQDQTCNVGATVTFTSTASGTPAPSEQWEVSTDGGLTWNPVSDGGVYSGAMTTTLTITGATADMTGYKYLAFFSNIVGQATSNSATLTVTSGVAPVFESIEVNGGTPQYHDAFGDTVDISHQNSVVLQILVTFNEPVTLVPGAFSVVPYSINNGSDPLASGEVLVNSGPNPNQVAPLLNAPIQVGDGHQWIITFGNNAGTTPNGSGFYVLKDGVYSLNIDHTKVSANSQNMAADVGGPGASSFWALYGDTTFHDISGVDHPGYIGDTYSDASVGNADFQGFKACYNSDSTNYYAPPSYNVKFDANLDGSVANSDFVQFKTNYNTDWQF